LYQLLSIAVFIVGGLLAITFGLNELAMALFVLAVIDGVMIIPHFMPDGAPLVFVVLLFGMIGIQIIIAIDDRLQGKGSSPQKD
jgi:hypothetical protein